MNLTYMITRSNMGGAQVHVYDLIRYAVIDNNVSLLVGEEGILTEKVRKLGVNVVIIPSLTRSINPLRDFYAINQVISKLNEIKPDLIHAHSSKAGIIGRIAGSKAKIPCIFTAHGWAFSEGASFLNRAIVLPIEKLVAKLGAPIICVSEYDRLLALKYGVCSPGKIKTVHNGIEDLRLNFKSDDSNTVSSMMVARFSRQKDYSTLIHAIQGLDSNCQFRFVGDGELLDSMKELSRELGVDSRIEFSGVRYDVPELLASADIFILSSNFEGFPISILEAMRSGIPVIASDVGGVREAVIDGYTGYLVPRGDVKTLRARLERLISNPDLRREMGSAARQHFLENFSIDKMVQQVFTLYNETVSNQVIKK